MELRILPHIEDVPAAQWNGLAGADNPFLRHEFLAALERHGAVGEATGWLPQHLAIYAGKRLVAAAPAYLKSHSWGEFVFDFAWADAYARHGLDYYPKLVIAVPFTPATGPRMLTAPGQDRAALITALTHGVRELVAAQRISGAHWLFPRRAEMQCIAAAGCSVREGCQYHWSNPGYADFDDFLAAMTSKKRKNIRRERRLVAESGVTMRIAHGDTASDADWHALHRFYRRTFRLHGNIPLISEACFREIGERLGKRVVLVMADREQRPVAGAICFRDDHWLYGRYWGCDLEIDGLHFETCYYQGIDYCIRRGLSGFEPGAQGEHKVPRGFLPVATYSCHYLADERFRQAIEAFVRRERSAVEDYIAMLSSEGPFRADAIERIRGNR